MHRLWIGLDMDTRSRRKCDRDRPYGLGKSFYIFLLTSPPSSPYYCPTLTSLLQGPTPSGEKSVPPIYSIMKCVFSLRRQSSNPQSTSTQQHKQTQVLLAPLHFSSSKCRILVMVVRGERNKGSKRAEGGCWIWIRGSITHWLILCGMASLAPSALPWLFYCSMDGVLSPIVRR